jgi:hypothetical protein
MISPAPLQLKKSPRSYDLGLNPPLMEVEETIVACAHPIGLQQPLNTTSESQSITAMLQCNMLAAENF